MSRRRGAGFWLQILLFYRAFTWNILWKFNEHGEICTNAKTMKKKLQLANVFFIVGDHHKLITYILFGLTYIKNLFDLLICRQVDDQKLFTLNFNWLIEFMIAEFQTQFNIE